MEDGMDQAKFRLPRTAVRGAHAAKAMDSLLRPPLEVPARAHRVKFRYVAGGHTERRAKLGAYIIKDVGRPNLRRF
eukprot:451495-Alexandrium_andersonii.AAC.1